MTLPKGTEIYKTECFGCGAEIPVKVNAVGNVYFRCERVTAYDDNGKAVERCKTRLNIGSHGSRAIIAKYLEKQEENHDPEPENEIRDTAGEIGIGHNGGPALDDEPEPAGGEAHQSGRPEQQAATGKPERKQLSSWFD